MLRRLSYKQKTDDREAFDVVKGVAKRVIVVKSPDPKVFEEAIFIVREDYMNTGSLRGGKISTVLVAALSTLLGSGAVAAIMYFVM